MRKFITLVEHLGVPKGTKVLFEETKREDNTGKTGKILCTVPLGGALFYREEDLEETKA